MKSAAFFVAMALTGIPVQAAGVDRELPPDGTWALYHVTEEWDDGAQHTLSLQLSVVGQTIVEGEKCRWFELKLKPEGGESWSVFKWLVAEEQLKLGGTALADAHRAWWKRRDNPPRQVELQHQFARLYLFVPPPLKNAKTTGEQETLEWQRGKLQCDVAIVRTHNEFPGETTDTVYRLKLHNRVPFRVAAATLTVKSANGDTGTIEYALVDTGDNAKTEMPEAK